MYKVWLTHAMFPQGAYLYLVTASLSLIVTTGCLHRRVSAPNFAVHKCPHDSVPVTVTYNGELLNHGEVCELIDPATHSRTGAVFPMQAYNPYLDTDQDGDDAEPHKKSSRWDIWHRRDRD